MKYNKVSKILEKIKEDNPFWTTKEKHILTMAEDILDRKTEPEDKLKL